MISKMLQTVHLDFRSLEEWQAWHRANPWILDREQIQTLVETVSKYGLSDPVYGHISPEEITISGTNYRETIVARGLNSRNRAVLATMMSLAGESLKSQRIYAPEFVTSLAARLREICGEFVGSEYFSDPADRELFIQKHPTCTHQDILALTYPDDSYDTYVSCEVLEHIPSIQASLYETKRVLKPGGHFVATFPFAYMANASIHKARLVNGEIEYLTEPEYHGNPVGKGSLVFEIPGWNILDMCKTAGLYNARMRLVSSVEIGATGAECGGIFILIADA